MRRQRFQDGHPIEYDPDFRGPSNHRSFTDIICLFLFFIFIACWIGIAIYAFSSGDPNTFLVPKDSAGSRCGLDHHVKDKPYLFFFDLTQCVKPNVPFTGYQTPQVCVEHCPNEVFYWDHPNTTIDNLICDYEREKLKQPGGVSKAQADEWIKKKFCAQWYLPSEPFKKRCIPLNYDSIIDLISPDDFLVAILNIKIFLQAEEFGQNVVDDIVKSWWKILIGIAIALITCIFYIMMMRCLAAIMVWLSPIVVVGSLGIGIYFSAKKYIELKDIKEMSEGVSDDMKHVLEKKNTWLVLLCISPFFMMIVIWMLIFLPVGSVTSALFFPIFHWILQLIVIAFALSVALFLATTEKPLYRIANLEKPIESDTCSFYNKDECCPEMLQLSNNTACYELLMAAGGICKFQYMKTNSFYPYLQVINAFGFLWGTFFVSALGQMILASVFATWYWTWNKKDNLPFFAVTQATLRTLQYHTGTLAFGSSIIPICRVIRIMLEIVDHTLKKYDNKVTKAILSCCGCFFWCLEKFLKLIDENAYIMCAIYGKSFCCSAEHAFLLLMRNKNKNLHELVLWNVTDFLFFLGKLMITIGVGAISYVMFATDLTAIDNTGLNYNLGPVIVIMICTYIIATVFFDVYSMAVNTIFLCCLEDCERYDGSNEKPYFMSRSLKKVMFECNTCSRNRRFSDGSMETEFID